MNKKGQYQDIEKILYLILALVVLIPLLAGIVSLFNSLGQQNCPTCDCSQYQSQISNLTEQLEICKNQTKEIIYVNQTVEVSVEKIDISADELIINKEQKSSKDDTQLNQKEVKQDG